MLRHGVKDTEFEIFHALLVGAVDLPMVSQLKSPLLLPMDSRLMPRSQARVDATQTHRFPEFLQTPRQPLADAFGIVVGISPLRRPSPPDGVNMPVRADEQPVSDERWRGHAHLAAEGVGVEQLELVPGAEHGGVAVFVEAEEFVAHGPG